MLWRRQVGVATGAALKNRVIPRKGTCRINRRAIGTAICMPSCRYCKMARVYSLPPVHCEGRTRRTGALQGGQSLAHPDLVPQRAASDRSGAGEHCHCSRSDRPSGVGRAVGCHSGADAEPALSQHLFDISKAEGETEAEPHRVADHISRKVVTLEGIRAIGGSYGQAAADPETMAHGHDSTPKGVCPRPILPLR